MGLLFIIPVIKTLFLTIVLPEVFVMAHIECYRETETAILPHALIYPFWLFKLGKFVVYQSEGKWILSKVLCGFSRVFESYDCHTKFKLIDWRGKQ